MLYCEINKIFAMSVIKICYSDVMPLVAETVAYCLADDEKLSSRVMVAPDPASDSVILVVLWTSAVAWLSGEAEEVCVTEMLHTPEAVLFTPETELSEGRQHMLEAAATAALVNHISSAWMWSVNHIQDSRFSSEAGKAADSFRRQLKMPVADSLSDTPAQRARLRTGPF